jgi:hypothetical protein
MVEVGVAVAALVAGVVGAVILEAVVHRVIGKS